MKTRSRYFYWLLVLLVISTLACSAGGGGAAGAPTPTLITLPQGGGSGGEAITELPAGGVTETPAAPAATGGTVSICSLMTDDEAAALLGGPVTSAPRQGGEPGRRFVNCEYGSGQQSLTLQGGNAEQSKELLMAAAYNMQKLQAFPEEQKVIDDTMANLSSLTAAEVFDRISPMYESHCLTVVDLPGVADGSRWITCQKLHYAALAVHRGQTEAEISFLDIVWLNSSLSEADQQTKLITAVTTALSRLPAGAQTVP